MKDLMLDIETMGNRSTSAIIQIGACYFNRYTGEIGDNFLENILLKSSIEDWGLTVDPSTIQWWMEQENKSWMKDGKELMNVLSYFQGFAKEAKYAWSHSTFDIPILCNAYNVIGLALPFHYRLTRDIRTLTHLADVPKNETTEKRKGDTDSHNALNDCLSQVKYCVECFNKLKERK